MLRHTSSHTSKYSVTADRLREASVIRTEVFASPVSESVVESGGNLLKGLRIFKHGTFRDSMGFERAWEPIHLDEMVMYYSHLRESGVFPNVPVRIDHGFSAKDVVGYIESVYRDPEDDTFLSSDILLTEPDAYDKWKRGTLRSRSLEVGMYETNDGASYWPVIMGLAFVDIPAVEGLHNKGTTSNSVFFSQVNGGYNKETNQMSVEEFLAACRYASWVQAAEYAQTCQDWERSATYAQALEDHTAAAIQLGLEPAANHGRSTPSSFRVGGQTVTDSGTVQREIDILEAFQSDTVRTNRENFVTGLASSSRILASQVDHFTALVATMTTDQFKAFQAAYEGVGAPNLLAVHGANSGGTPVVGSDSPASQLEMQEEIVQRLKASGMTEDQVAKTSAFSKLQSLKAAQANG